MTNGLQEAIPDFLEGSAPVEGAIYHLTDHEWVIPAFAVRRGETELVYDNTAKDGGTNAPAVAELDRVRFFPRTRARIMHDKFLVGQGPDGPVRLLAGSANFTTEGLTPGERAPHVSLERARRVVSRQRAPASRRPTARGARAAGRLVEGDRARRCARSRLLPARAERLAALARRRRRGCRGRHQLGRLLPLRADGRTASARPVCGRRRGQDDVRPDQQDRAAEAERVPRRGLGGADGDLPSLEHDKDTYSHDLFRKGSEPQGFWWEVASLPGDASRFPVYIHHKFVVVDAETDHPTIYTGSANMSGNSLHYNDENLLEIKAHPGLARTYLAEFMRLYEHYRARAQWNVWHAGRSATFRLSADSSWAKAAYAEGTPQARSRIAMLGAG